MECFISFFRLPHLVLFIILFPLFPIGKTLVLLHNLVHDLVLYFTCTSQVVADYFQKWRTLSQIKKQGYVKFKIRKRRNDCTCTLHPMESQVPSIGGKSLLNISESILKKTPNATLDAFCSKYDLAVVYSKKRKRFVKEDYIESILHLVSNVF